MSKNTGGPAYPAQVSINRDSGEIVQHQFGNNDFVMPGMTLRDYFAAKAMQGMISVLTCGIRPEDVHLMAADCYVISDAMLAERDK